MDWFEAPKPLLAGPVLEGGWLGPEYLDGGRSSSAAGANRAGQFSPGRMGFRGIGTKVRSLRLQSSAFQGLAAIAWRCKRPRPRRAGGKKELALRGEAVDHLQRTVLR